ncbi:MAG TPA: GAF domain-containing SpoIIE family protein phosphatase [Ktedonosporobacter sp.]|nr:GAF domain-containing SpoIIE family protein phosphatase [Ktedonosporobacter sp.]
MPTFQVASRIIESSSLLIKRPTRSQRRWRAIRRVTRGWLLVGLIITTLVILLGSLGWQALFFLLLPVIISVGNAILFQRYSRNMLLLTTGLALVYFSIVAAIELLTHGPGTLELIVVTTTLTLAVMFEPARNWAQSFFEQRFQLNDTSTSKAIERFNATLREEIDLEQLRTRLLSSIQQTMQPQAVALWVLQALDEGETPTHTSHAGQAGRQTPHKEGMHEPPAPATDNLSLTVFSEMTVADNDPIIAYISGHPGAVEIERLRLDSSLLREWQASQVELVLPLASQGEFIGLLTLGPRLSGQGYTREERTLLNTLATQVAPALRVTQMVQQQQEQALEQERIEQEMRTAQAIQRTFLPKDTPVLPGWQLLSYYQPAREVGGDFYDFLPFEDGRLGLVIGDVSGKGIPAALLMTATRTMLRTAAIEQATPGEVLTRVNDLLSADIPPGIFVTCFYAILDRTSGRLHYANAGHELPYHRGLEGVSELWATGMPLGMLPGSQYEEKDVVLAPGESLLFYSDGLVEAHNAQRDMLGFPRLMALIGEHPGGPGLIDFLMNQMAMFTGGEEQEDDITMIALHRASTFPDE